MKDNISRAWCLLVCFIFIMAIGGCEKTGAVKGRVIAVPPGSDLTGVTISAVDNGNIVASAAVSPDGEFLIKPLKPGKYDIRIKTPAGTLELDYGIKVAAGNTATIEDIELPPDALPSRPDTPPPDQTNNAAKPIPLQPSGISTVEAAKPPSGAGVAVNGSVHPPFATARILDGEKVISSANAVGGKFTAQNVPPGIYDVEFSSPGYANQTITSVAVSAEGVTYPLNGFLLYRSPIDGVNYDKGVVVATGLGKPNPNMPPAQAALMACRAARVVAYRNLLDTLLSIQIEQGKTVRQLDAGGAIKSGLQGLVQGARIVRENKTPLGVCEITLEINLYGSSGVTGFIRSRL